MMQQTSLWANASVQEMKPDDRAMIVEQLRRRPMTTDELEVVLKLKHQTCSARVSELSKEKNGQPPRIRDSGKKRNTRSGRKAIVWELV